MVNRFLLSLLLLTSLAQAETGPALATVTARASGEAAVTSADGVVEAAEGSDLVFWLGVQWHPERGLGLPGNRELFAAFVAAAARHGR